MRITRSDSPAIDPTRVRRTVRPDRNGRSTAVAAVLAAIACLLPVPSAQAQGATPASTPAEPPPLQAVASVDVERYLGTWYQVAWFPNRFQRQCVRDTAATYTRGPDDTITVRNACRTAGGEIDEVIGQARAVGRLADGRLQPAQLRVSFLPAWLRWTGIGWGRYWVIELPDDYRYAVVSEPTREYLWVLAREPRLSDADRAGIRQRLVARGFDLSNWQDHPHGPVPGR